MDDLRGKVCLASTGTSAAVGRALAAHGASVAVHYRGHDDDAPGPLRVRRGAHHGVGQVTAAAALFTLPPLRLFMPLQTKLSAGLGAGAVKQ
jgi:NAD(P)-dependent dehydrogenase (short-subunit alcohol dehydrogenase family)